MPSLYTGRSLLKKFFFQQKKAPKMPHFALLRWAGLRFNQM